jgi:WXXGXW repeat (2 copies)
MKRATPFLLSLALVLAACGAVIGEPPAVPPPRPETLPLPPLSAEAQIWRPGHWDWDGRGYVWVPGEYQPRGTHSGVFQHGLWQRGPNGYGWYGARWL